LNNVVKKHYGPDFDRLETIVHESSLVLVNSEELVDFPRPIWSNVLYIAGIGLLETDGDDAELDSEWKQLVESAESDIVLISFGSITNASAMPTSWKVTRSFMQKSDKKWIKLLKTHTRNRKI